MSEIWKPIKGYEGLYEVSNLGRVKSLSFRNSRGTFKRDLIMKSENCHGYKRLSLSTNDVQKGFSVHRLVSQAFISNPDNKTQINHKDYDKTNNHVENLEWCTAKENTRHAVAGGRKGDNRGEKHGQSELTEAQVKRIRLMKEITPNITQRVIANMFNVSQSQISHILLREQWKHI